ncbi:MAG: hypothetical protein QOG84_2504 [Sphingomonadales bacterium]|jgi:hypothetical protein|nr:hypothetical protein [Sphingomonadales bacterium]
MVWRVAEFVIGIVVAAMTLRDVFDTVIVPGGSHASLHIARRLVFLLLPVWKRMRGRQRGLSTMFAPLVLVISFALWMALLALAFGLLAYALRDDFRPPLAGFGDAVYAVGSALVTVGQGHGGVIRAARWVVLAAGFCGLAVMTMAVTYLLEVQSSIARRDSGILKLRTSAGDPPTAIALLEKYQAIGARDELPRVLRDGRDWCATVRQSHTSHPSLVYFRTIGTGSGWPAALGALLDLALIVERRLDAPELAGLAILLREDGRRMAEDLGRLVDLEEEPEAPDSAGAGEMDRRLAAAGYSRQAGFDADAFAAEREGHAAWIRALGHHLGRHPGGLLPVSVDPAPDG